MDVVNTVINRVLLMLTAAVVVYAARTIGESKKATTAAQNTVTARRERPQFEVVRHGARLMLAHR